MLDFANIYIQTFMYIFQICQLDIRFVFNNIKILFTLNKYDKKIIRFPIIYELFNLSTLIL